MDSQQTFNFSDYLTALARRAKLACIVGGAVFAIAIVLCVTLPAVYRSTATFQLRDTAETQGFRGNNDYADTYISALRDDVLSDANRSAVVKQFKPYPDLNEAAARMRLNSDVNVTMVTERILDPMSGRERDVNSGFTLSYDNPDPEVAHKIADWLTEAFVHVSREDAAKRIRSQAAFLNAEAERTRQKIAALEGQLADFKRKNFDQLPEAAQSNLTRRAQAEQELESTERELGTLQHNRFFIVQQMQQARAANSDSQLLYDLQDQYRRKAATYDENHPDMIALRRQIDSLKRGTAVTGTPSLEAQLKTQKSILEEMRQRYSEEHPDVKKMKRDIASLEQRIAAGERGPVGEAAGDTAVVVQLQTQLNATDTQIAALQSRSTELRKRLQDFDVRMAATPKVEQDYEALSRDLGTARQQYEQLLAQRMDAEVKAAGMIAGTADRFRLVDEAAVPKDPAKPRRLMIAILGFIGGLIVALMTAIGAEMIDTTVRGSKDVRSILNVTPLAVIPEIQEPRGALTSWWRSRQAARAAASVLVSVSVLSWLVVTLNH